MLVWFKDVSLNLIKRSTSLHCEEYLEKNLEGVSSLVARIVAYMAIPHEFQECIILSLMSIQYTH